MKVYVPFIILPVNVHTSEQRHKYKRFRSSNKYLLRKISLEKRKPLNRKEKTIRQKLLLLNDVKQSFLKTGNSLNFSNESSHFTIITVIIFDMKRHLCSKHIVKVLSDKWWKPFLRRVDNPIYLALFALPFLVDNPNRLVFRSLRSSLNDAPLHNTINQTLHGLHMTTIKRQEYMNYREL